MDDPHCEMARDFSDVHLLGKRGSSRQVVGADQLDERLGRPVDHRVRHNARLTEGGAQRESREDVPEREMSYLKNVF